MKRMQRRGLLVLILTVLLACGMLLFCVRCATKGRNWVNYFAGSSLYASGSLYDRSGLCLYDGEKRQYAESAAIREATYHIVGDGSVGSSVRKQLSSRLAGFNPLTGVTLGRHDLQLSIDAKLCQTVCRAFQGRRGMAALYNYETGELLCEVSLPNLDPQNPPESVEDSRYQGVYLNRFLSGRYPPGSIFKIVTTAAALENLPDVAARRFTCTGRMEVAGEVITCPMVHGKDMDLATALARSCNCAYGELALLLGGDTLARYVQSGGLLEEVSVSGITAPAGSFTPQAAGSAALAWSGVGQDEDLINPVSFLRLMGGIARGGEGTDPCLVLRETLAGSQFPIAPAGGGAQHSLWSAQTCRTLADYMENNVRESYGHLDFDGLTVCAKSGTAEVGGGEAPHSWFAGFVRDAKAPLAFLVLVENGGSGAQNAGRIAALLVREGAKLLAGS